MRRSRSVASCASPSLALVRRGVARPPPRRAGHLRAAEQPTPPRTPGGLTFREDGRRSSASRADARQRTARRARLPHGRGLEPCHARALQPPRGLGPQPAARHHRRPAAARGADRARRRGRHPPRRGGGRTGAPAGHPHRHRLRRPRRRALSGLRRALERGRPARRRRRELRLRRALPARSSARSSAPSCRRWGLRDRDDATYFPMPWLLSTAGYGVLVEQHRDQPVPPGRPRRPGASRPSRRGWSCGSSPGPGPPTRCARLTRSHRPPAARRLRAGSTAPGSSPPATRASRSRWSRRLRRGDVPASAVNTFLHYLPCGDQEGIRERSARARRRSSGRASRSRPTSTRWCAPATGRPSAPPARPAR